MENKEIIGIILDKNQEIAQAVAEEIGCPIKITKNHGYPDALVYASLEKSQEFWTAFRQGVKNVHA